MPDKEHNEDNKLALYEIKMKQLKKPKGKNISKRKFQIVLLEFS